MELNLFYEEVLRKKSFYIPVTFFVLVGYSFSMYNRTIDIDDLMREFNLGNGNRCLAGRWGAVLWNKMVGLGIVYDPFIERFLSVIFLVAAAVLFCYILYSIGREKRVLSYTLTASMFVSYPLFNENWYYAGAWMVTSNMCMVSLGLLIIKSNLNKLQKNAFATLVLVLPVSSYETSAFYYITLVCIVIYLERFVVHNSFEFWGIIKNFMRYMLPLALSIVVRFLVSFVINEIYGLQYTGGGAVGIAWIEGNFLHVLKNMIGFNLVKYGLYALVYFPIFIFILMLFVFVTQIMLSPKNRFNKFLLGGIITISLFSQSILQGMELPYRHAHSFILFVSFVTWQLCNIHSINICRIPIRRIIYLLLFVLCWHQSVYLNRINGLNDLRSDNEVACIHQIGSRLVSEYDNKPVVFVGFYNMGNYIRKYVSVDEKSWNGRLFYFVYDNLLARLDRPHKYISSNVTCATADHHQVQQLFNYFGYDINCPYQFKGNIEEFTEETQKIERDAAHIVREKRIKPYQIYDNGEYIIVNLGEANL